ncbi:hypothetical protein fugu_001651 [Takifugu bimaculatus]|uniref:Protein kinase domain-containing protein n=1 Tax=Takifugu bimaculatus TaxID=433685 RepID=A0A4Z2BMF5_9TELE|nr:hypothetical protein fugu_001651 [Takifugu bimaculatus]
MMKECKHKNIVAYFGSYHRVYITYMKPAKCTETLRMAPEVVAVEKKGGYNHLCDIWALGITAIELAELQPPLFDLHPMRALMLMSKSNFQPPRLKDKSKWSSCFQSFVKMAVTKNPRKRPSAETLLQHAFVTQLLTCNLVIELLDMASNPDLHSVHVPNVVDELENGEVTPDKIHSARRRLPAERTRSEEHCKDTCKDTEGRKSALFSPSSASLPAFTSLASSSEDSGLLLRSSCTLKPDGCRRCRLPLSFSVVQVLCHTRHQPVLQRSKPAPTARCNAERNSCHCFSSQKQGPDITRVEQHEEENC